MHEYRTARTIFGFVEFCIWSLTVVGAALAYAGLAGGDIILSGGGVIAMMPGLAMAFYGIVGVMLVQIGRASVDTAEMTGKLLANSESQLRLMQTQSGSGAGVSVAKPSLAKREHTPRPIASEQPSTEITEYKGTTIERRGSIAFVGQHRFESIAAAKRHIDSIATPVALPIEPVSPPPVPVTDPNKLEHLGRRIEPVDGGWKVDGIRFATVEKARAHIEATTLRAER